MLDAWQRAALHDLRSRLGTILVSAQLLEEDGRAPDVVPDLLQAAREAKLLLERLSALAPPDPVSVDLDGLVAEIAGGRAVEGRGGHVLADPLAVRNILVHLVANALEAGSTQVAFRLTHSAVTVADDGPGVSAEVAEKLFERPVSSKGEGRGEGLYSARQVLRTMGGDLWCEPSSVGAAFTLRLTPHA